MLVTFVGLVNALGRVGTGRYSDRIGRLNAYALNGVASAACLFAAPWVLAQQNVFLLFAVIFAQATFNLTFLQPDTSEETLIFAALSAFIFLLFVALTFVLMRNLLKLFAERRLGVLGSNAG